MWISPQFHLKVIRAYDRLATKGVAERDGHGNSGQLSHSRMQCRKWQGSP